MVLTVAASRPAPVVGPVARLHRDVDTASLLSWYARHRRPLPWREPGTSPWAVLLSEVMSQQTPVARVEPRWREWLERWPAPADLAAAPRDEVLRAWGRLGYPRRALRLRDCAAEITRRFGGEVPGTVEELESLPGIGDYTARAVASFAFGLNVPVVDTNVRRVVARAEHGRLLAGAARKADLEEVAALLPEDDELGPVFSSALMELGALVCRARRPDCGACPLLSTCRWQELGRPEPSEEEKARAKGRVQKFAGTDRQVRGLIMARLREAPGPVAEDELAGLWDDGEQLARARDSLLRDGLAERVSGGRLALPS